MQPFCAIFAALALAAGSALAAPAPSPFGREIVDEIDPRIWQVEGAPGLYGERRSLDDTRKANTLLQFVII